MKMIDMGSYLLTLFIPPLALLWISWYICHLVYTARCPPSIPSSLLPYCQNHGLKTYIYQLPLKIGVVMWHSFGQWEANEWSGVPWRGVRVGRHFGLLILPAWSEDVMLKRQHKLQVAEGEDRKGLELWECGHRICAEKALVVDF